MYNRDEIGKRIKSARQEKHLSQMQFAELINVSTPYLSDIENGKTNLSLDIFTRITYYVIIILLNIYIFQLFQKICYF